MPTYGELRSAALVMLDQDPSLEGDVVDLLDFWLYEIHRKLAREFRPVSLLANVAIDIDETDGDSFSLSTDFSITDFLKENSLKVNEDINNSGEERTWEYVPYQTWISNDSPAFGELNPLRSWTLNGSQEIEINSVPVAGQDWRLRFYYFKKPAAFNIATTPELPEDHHYLIAIGAALEFPHFFQGDRGALLAKLQGDYLSGKVEMMRDRGPATKNLRFVLPNDRGSGAIDR